MLKVVIVGHDEDNGDSNGDNCDNGNNVSSSDIDSNYRNTDYNVEELDWW